MSARISKVDYFLPSQILSNKDLEKEFPEWSADKIESKIGIKQRHLVGKDETSLDLAYQAAEKVLKDFDRTTIDFVLLCTQSPDFFLPTSACLLQEKLNLKVSAGALDFNLGCSGYIYGLALAKGLVAGGIAENILLVTSETYSKFIHPKDKANRSIFGDAAAATIIQKYSENKIYNFDLGTNGAGKDNLIVPNGGMRSPYCVNPKIIEDESGNYRTDNYLFMNGPEIFNFTIDNVPITVKNCLEKNSITIEQIDMVIFHQANQFMLNHLRKKMKIPKEKFYISMENTGNTVSSTIPIALKNALNENAIKSGDKVLLVGFGVGYSWGSTIIQI